MGQGEIRTLATWNPGTLSGQFKEAMDWVRERQVDVLCVQEHRMSLWGEREKAERLADEAGYRIMWGEQDWARGGDGTTAVRGVAIITRVKAQHVRKEGMPDPTRVVAAKVYRGGARPLLVGGVYLCTCF